MTAPAAIHELVEKFEQHRKEYQQHKNETELRREFLDPFFEALGWDVFNRKSYSERFKEVMHESSVEVEGQAKAADYAFRAGDRLIFFVEAKKPSVNIEINPMPAFQLRRYGWSAKLPINILTDFEQLAVYDCRAKPDKDDKASLGRVKLYHYSEYVEKWDEISGLFGHEAVLRGALEQFVDAQKGKKGTAEVDDAFLEEIERWRDLLARNLALRNSSLNVRELNYAVQMTIDRIVFLRICEDRGIEPDEQLHEIATPAPSGPTGHLPQIPRNSAEFGGGQGGSIYANLLALFKRADTKYNSGLFHFAEDMLTPALQIDDKVLKDILHNLYYPESPYVFNYISADILGQVYERFLGKVIRLTAGHQAKVEEKPEVRKAGGVYYTPTYIVDYIVKNTIGKLVDGKTPENVTKLKFVDPACGSGSFLLGAYQYLLDWHLQWYTTNEPEKWARGSRPAIYQSEKGEWRLTTEEKKQILLANIHGVDIDAQAVEVTKLSLLLKVLEGASGQLRLGLERVLPDLSQNIQCGNSLIGPDYYDGRQMPMFGDDEFYRVNVFEWHKAFPQVFDPHPASPKFQTREFRGGEKPDSLVSPKSDVSQSDLGEVAEGRRGFDAVIGNPPYIRIQALQEWAPTEVEFYKQKYKAASKGNYDIYVVFVEKALSLLNANGKLGYILPHKFFNAQYGEPLRGIISSGKHLSKVVHFSDQQIFENATTYTCLMFLNKTRHDEFEFEKVENLNKWRDSGESIIGKIAAENVKVAEWNFTVGKNAGLFEKLARMPMKLGDIAEKMAQGIRTSANEIYVVDYRSDNSSEVSAYSKQLDKDVKIEKGALSLFLQGREIKRYRILPSGKMVIIPYSVENKHAVFISIDGMKKQYPQTYSYLLENKSFLENRENGKMRGDHWFAYVYPKNIDLMKQSKILIPDIADRAQFALDENGEYAFTSGYGITLKDNSGLSPKYVLGLLNSKLLEFYLKRVSTPMQNGFFRFFTQFIEKLPIHPINFSVPAEKAAHDRLVVLVEAMLALHKQSPRTPQEKDMLARQIESTDAAIDKLVYELYGLTEEEIKVVEGKE